MSMPGDIREINRSVIEEFRANGGVVTQLGLENTRVVLLTTTGVKTGLPRTTPLGCFEDGPGRVFVWASAMAAPAHPAWYRNLAANPRVTIELGTGSGTVEHYEAIATTAEGAERERLLGVLKEARPHIAAHQDRTDREIPVVVVEYRSQAT
ncbi:nitroreductase/quinone reductase family protein [Actinomadura macrotermitis]|uniref:Deazaflavin-dependent nitroreductase n=1 Tax=Actinomadura macrotermitis TaxID=2585200 RepID=A0A7K0BWS2_9ACTN|nr:nitroreductase/quinone reductase family protein [Actinomadura macrotermitis]MQY05617.1 Deazaflavin-dependent nitroreductase [Actinomadura macrotermitis]